MPTKLLCVAVLIVSAQAAFAQTPAQEPQTKTDSGLTVAGVADKVSRTESAVLARMRGFQPIIEVYLQNMDPKLATQPIKDQYILGQFQWSDVEGPLLNPLTPEKGSLVNSGGIFKMFSTQYFPSGFAAMTAADWRGIDTQRYHFEYVRREFLGEARCLVFDIQPTAGQDDGFSGRIWVEDKDFNIVRFNGITRMKSGPGGAKFMRKILPFHVDSWRTNVGPGMWLPSYIYAEEADLPKGVTMPLLRSQVRLWGYQLKGVKKTQELTQIRIADAIIQDTADAPQQLSPVLSQRQWAQQAEENILDRLMKAGLLAPPNGVDKVLETVVHNLEITSNLTIEPEVHVRVLLTSPLHSFTVGHTIVLSRGLIDVLPDEASLAMVLAHELSHIALDHQVIDTRFAFADKLMVPDNQLLDAVQVLHSDVEETSADISQIDMLKKSPYKEKLGEAGLFLKAVAANVKNLPNLIGSHVGDEVFGDGRSPRLAVLMQSAPELAPASLLQVAALPLGARLIVDPWSSQLELLRNTNAQAMSSREKLPLAIAPLMPYLRYVEPTVAEAR
jgi:hypothetical protein